MSCDPELLRQIALFALLDDEELAVLASQVETRTFQSRQRIYKIGDDHKQGYLLIEGSVAVTAVDEDGRDVIVDQPGPGEFFGFAAMLGQTAHRTEATALADCVCVEIDRTDILILIERKPHAGMDLLTVLSRQIHSAHELVRSRAMRNANEIIEEESTRPQRIADSVARFGGSWAFILSFLAILVVYAALNIALGKKAWDPYPFILLNLFLSMLAAIQAPVIMMSQNRQDQRDRLRSELDYDVNRRAESEIQDLSRKLNLLHEKIGDLEDLVRKPGDGPATRPIAP